MSILKIVTYPDSILKRVSGPVLEVDVNLQKFMDNMVETMYHSNGWGLSAVQVGLLKRIFVIDISDTKDQPLYFINPEVTYSTNNKELMKEGCLSFPNTSAEVERFLEVEVKYLDYNGNTQILKANGLMAHVIQHEMDHLEGIVYTDHLSVVKSTLIKQKVKKSITKKIKN